MKKRYLVILLLFALSLACFAACNITKNYEGQAKITYELEGGVYNNCTLPVIHYYDIPNGQSVKIREMTAFGSTGSSATFKREGYQLEGWYKTKNANGTYSNKWNFDKDTVRAGEELTLYANWEVPVKHTFDIYYINENNEKVLIESMSAKQGDTCNLVLVESSAAAAREGYTIVDYVDAEGNLWDENFAHPGGDEDLSVEIYVKYVKGEYNVVKTADDFAIGNIYLARDIDMEGATLDLSYFVKGEFEGNGHTVSNFKIGYTVGRDTLVTDFEDDSLRALSVSIFGLLNGATVRDVTFDNFSVEVSFSVDLSAISKIYISPLSGSIQNTTLNNVHVSNFELKTGKLPNRLSGADVVVIVTDGFAYKVDNGTTTIDDKCSISQTAPSDN